MNSGIVTIIQGEGVWNNLTVETYQHTWPWSIQTFVQKNHLQILIAWYQVRNIYCALKKPSEESNPDMERRDIYNQSQVRKELAL